MRHFFIVLTTGFSYLPDWIGGDILLKGMAWIRPDKPDMLAFDPKRKETVTEDDGRTLIIAYPRLDEKVYVKLDDYGSAEALSENVGHPVNTQYAVTFMLAGEY